VLPPDFKLRKEACAELIRDPETLTLPLMTILLSAYGEYLFEVDSVELYADIEEDFNASLTVEGENRIQAAILAMTTDLFYTDPLSTRSIALAFYEGDLGDLVNGVLEEVELPEIIWAAYELGLLREDDEDFSPPVQAFIDELVKGVADEMDMETGEILPHYARVLEVQKRELREQMGKLGFDELELPDEL